MPRLIVINGPPACGKSTLARMYAAGHALALVIDVDAVRGCLGCWRENLPSAGRAARVIALAGAGAHLRAGHDVVVPQFLRRPGFLTELQNAARDSGAGFAEIALLASKEEMLRAFAGRAASARPADVAAHELAGRPGAVVIPVAPGQPDLTYAAMLAALDGRSSLAPGNHSR